MRTRRPHQTDFERLSFVRFASNTALRISACSLAILPAVLHGVNFRGEVTQDFRVDEFDGREELDTLAVMINGLNAINPPLVPPNASCVTALYLALTWYGHGFRSS